MSGALGEGSSGGRAAGRDAAIAMALVVAFALVYRLTAQERFANDGPQLARAFVLVPDAVHWQVLYLPLARWVRGVVAWGDPFEALRIVGAVGAAVGVGASYLVARGLGAGRWSATAGAAAVAVARYVWFFATSVEVHALHFGMVGVAACATLYGPWRRRPAVALGVAAAAFAACWTTHATAILLGPGWVALCAWARARVAPPFRVRTLLLVVGPVLLAAYLAVMLPVKAWWVRETGGAADVEWGFLTGYARYADRSRFLLEGLIGPLGVVVPLVVIGIALRARDAVGWTLAALLVPGTAFLVWWAVPEDGGYFLGHAPFHAAAAAAACERVSRRWWAVVPVGWAACAAASFAWIERFDARLHPEDRVALAREAVGDEGYLGKIAYLAPDVTIWEPGIEEVDLTGRLRAGFDAGIEGEELARGVVPMLAGVMAQRAVAMDLSYADERWDLAGPEFVAYVDRFVAEVTERFLVERFERGGWRIVRLRAKR